MLQCGVGIVRIWRKL